MMRIISACAIAILCMSPRVNAAEPAADRVKVAFIAGYTGSDPNTAKELDRGMQAFLTAVPEARKHLEIETFDNKGSVIDTLRIMAEIQKKKIAFIIGIARSDEALAAAKAAGVSKMLFITPFATNSKITQQGNDIFQMCFTDAFQGEVLARLITEDLKPKKILLLVNSESVYSTGLAESFTSALGKTKKSAEISRIEYTEKEMGVDKILEAAKKLKPDVVVIPDHITRAALLAKALRKQNAEIKFLGGDGFGGQKILTGIYGDTPDIELWYTTHWHPGVENKTNHWFIDNYAKIASGSEPTSGAALTFDAFNILWETLKRSNFKGTPDQVATAMRKEKFQVTTGTLEMPKKKDEGTKKAAVVMHLKNGKYHVFKTVYP